MRIIDSLILWCSPKYQLALIKAELIPQIILTINPLSLSFAEAVNIHTHLVSTILSSIGLATPYCLAQLGNEDENDQQAVHETIPLMASISEIEKENRADDIKSHDITPSIWVEGRWWSWFEEAT
ncbi:hypothetical protein BLNAU_11637 [Blattamonas nauphoetae]|uniref:Uncharacterized protein n=1 Tax=Blattamonas nauphoetae TaxID=2049346 RepID=A0ABQ9XRG5_9EUKA|nr:hypothetical protein BLNAU_11637 [Blattamonas nauphoetae]